MSRDLQKATPFMREFSNLLIAHMKTEHGIRVIVTSVDRDYKVQMALYAQGRQPLSEVNRMRSFAGLPLISEKENRPVTWTMASKHIVNFDDGFTGQVITVIAESSLTITDGTNIFLAGSANFAMAATDTLTLICKLDGNWYELGRSDN